MRKLVLTSAAVMLAVGAANAAPDATEGNVIASKYYVDSGLATRAKSSDIVGAGGIAINTGSTAKIASVKAVEDAITAAASSYATSVQGGLADSALQSADIATSIAGSDNSKVAGEKAVKDYVDSAVSGAVPDAYTKTQSDTKYVTGVAEGTGDGQIGVTVNGVTTQVNVHGLGSAAYTSSSAYDVSGAAATALADAKSYADTNDADHITTVNATVTGSGNAVTSITADTDGKLTLTKDTTFLTSSDISGKMDKVTCDEGKMLVANSSGGYDCASVASGEYKDGGA
jgi:hypothetical protein